MSLLNHVISFSYNAALLAEEDAKSPKSDFFPDWNLRFEMAGKSKQSSFTHDLASSLMHAPIEGYTGIAIFMPTSKCSLPVAGSRFFLLLIVHLALSNGAKQSVALVNQAWVGLSISSYPLKIMIFKNLWNSGQFSENWYFVNKYLNKVRN